SVNASEGIINMAGAGTHGMTAQKGTLINEGSITVDGMQLHLDENLEPDGTKTLFKPEDPGGRINSLAMRGTGMHLRNGGSMLNTGTIQVTNSGTGMYADGSALAINQGTINLESDGSHDEQGWIYAMAAIDNGMAINDTTGVININTDLGLAFYTSGNGKVFNFGTVNFNGSPINNGDPNWGSPSLESDYVLITTPVLTAEGESHTWRDESLPWLLLQNSASYGDAIFDGELAVENWLQNFGSLSVTTLTGGSLNNAGTLVVGEMTGNTLLNSGTLTADSMSIVKGVNLEDGVINAHIVSQTFRNDGTIFGSVKGGGSQSHVLINNGTIAVTEAGVSGMQAANIYNQQGGHIYNTVAATPETAESSVLMRQTPTSVTPAIVNAGTLTASDGWYAMKATAASGSSQTWMANTETGVIRGVMDASLNDSLVVAGRGYHFYNAGEITVQGSDAKAVNMGGSTATGPRRMINDGVINVGTEQGKQDGTNGTGLTGVYGTAATGIFYNNSGGEINVWADDSYAFNVKGTLYNFGAVNLHGTNSALYHPDSTQAIVEGDDFSRPNVSTPGNISTPNPPTAPTENGASLVNNYVIGTNADGTAGKLGGNNLHIDSTVTISAGFTAGTAAKEITFSDVFTGNSISGAENIGSQTVVWNAQGHKNADGNVDVTMTKNDYAEVITDKTLSGVAAALDNGYTSNSLYSSLNVSTSAELDRALKQVSGAQATA
ncbi:hypothetical protein DT73_06385, partial [Mangrovibacter sp. MFB070]